jgi:hypothetical protein
MVRRRISDLLALAASCGVVAASAGILAATAITLVTPSPVLATPAFTTQTKLPCTRCHTSPAGGADKLTDFGKEFKANGNKLKQ